MSSLELIDKRDQLKVQASAIISGAEKESRKLTDEENTTFESLKQQIANVEKDIRDLENKLNNTKTTKRTMEKFSLLKAINDVANNRNLDEKSQEIVNAGIAEMRKAGQSYSGQIVLPVEQRNDIQATVTSAGEEVVAEDKLQILEPLRANLVMAGAGANFMTGLVGNVSIPVYSGSNVGWAGEIEEAADGAGTFSEVNLEPKRLTAYLDISKQFLIQDSVSAEEMLRNDIVRAITNKLEATIFGKEAGSTTKPAGIFNGKTLADATSFAKVCAIEAGVENANVYGDMKYLLSTGAKADLRAMAKSSKNTQLVYEGGEVDGVPAFTTSNVVDAGSYVYGDFSNLAVASWGDIDITVDEYTQAVNGCVRLVVNAYFDAKVLRPEGFAFGNTRYQA